MQLSFIVPAHNEQDYLRPTLEAIFAAAGAEPHPFEVIVVNDASTDATGDLAASLGARVIDVMLRNIGAVRNAGARQSKGDVLFFVDADTRITAEVVSAALAALADGATGGGASVRYDGQLPLYVRLLKPYVDRRFERKKVLIGVFLFCTREGFEAVGGFDPAYYAAEEVHFCRALRKQGRMVRLQQPVLSSGRKFRSLPWWRVLHVMLNMRQTTPRGQAWVKDKRNLDFWYGSNSR